MAIASSISWMWDAVASRARIRTRCKNPSVFGVESASTREPSPADSAPA